VRNAIGVLVDQPIRNPIEEVTEFRFIPAAPGCGRGDMGFTKPIVNRDGENWYYRFGNAE